MSRWVTIFGSVIGAYAAILSVNAMSNGIDLLAGELGTSVHKMSSATSLYLVAQIASTPLALLWLRYGSIVRVNMIASLCFALTSALCFVSTTLDSFLVARIAQGLTSGVMIASPPIIIRHYLVESHHPKGLAIFSFIASIAPLSGPIFTGLLQHSDIQLIFVITGLFSLLSVLLLSKKVTPLSPQPNKVITTGSVVALLVFTTGLGLFVYALESGHDLNWFSSITIRVCLFLAGIFVLSSVAHQVMTKTPLVPFKLLVHKDLGSIYLTSFGIGIAIYGFMYLLPYYLIQAHGSSPWEIMVIIMYSAIPQVLLLPLFVRIKDKVPSTYVVSFGAALMCLSMYLLSFSNQYLNGEELLFPQILRAIGIPMAVMSLSLLIMKKAPESEMAGAVVLQGIFRTLGGALSISLMTAYVHYRQSAYLQSQFYQTDNVISEERTWQFAFSDTFSIMFCFFLFMTVVLLLSVIKTVFSSLSSSSPNIDPNV